MKNHSARAIKNYLTIQPIHVLSFISAQSRLPEGGIMSGGAGGGETMRAKD
jgi:hypothetical protein